jgi:hypothetical protein
MAQPGPVLAPPFLITSSQQHALPRGEQSDTGQIHWIHHALVQTHALGDQELFRKQRAKPRPHRGTVKIPDMTTFVLATNGEGAFIVAVSLRDP